MICAQWIGDMHVYIIYYVVTNYVFFRTDLVASVYYLCVAFYCTLRSDPRGTLWLSLILFPSKCSTRSYGRSIADTIKCDGMHCIHRLQKRPLYRIGFTKCHTQQNMALDKGSLYQVTSIRQSLTLDKDY